MGRWWAAARERCLASRHATGMTRRPWRLVGADVRTRSMACLAVPLAMAGLAATQAPDGATTFGDKVVRCQTSETEAEGSPLEGQGHPNLLLLRQIRGRVLLQSLATPSSSSNALSHPLHSPPLLRRSRRRPHLLGRQGSRRSSRRWQLGQGGWRIHSRRSGCSRRTPASAPHTSPAARAAAPGSRSGLEGLAAGEPGRGGWAMGECGASGSGGAMRHGPGRRELAAGAARRRWRMPPRH
jgi:hypothetical protein